MAVEMTLQTIKEKIDGLHCLVAIGQLSIDDCGDEIGQLTKNLSQQEFDEAHDYKWESRCKFGLDK